MKNKKQYTNAKDEKYEDAEGGENEEHSSCSSSILSDEDDRCPICLNCLAEQEVGFPENCCHIFCMACILKWAETRASCPVDRKQFQAVYKLCALEDCIKVQIKQPLSKADDLLNCNEGKYCPMNMKNCIRRPLTANFYKNWNQKHSSSNKEDKNSVSLKKKPRRQTCSNRFFRSNLCDRFSSSSSFVGESPSYHNDCIEIDKIDPIIGRKRRELELSCSVLARMARIPSICHETQTDPCALVSTTLGTLFPMSTAPLENFGSFKKGHVVTYVQEGEEKKQTSGTAGTRGSRRKISDTTPRRRSARNVKTESSSQSQNSPRSSSSGCEASGDGSSFVNATCAESEKVPTKRKGKRGVKQQEPVVKKRLRSSGSYEKSSDIVEKGESETDKTLLVDPDNMPDIENSSSGFSHKNDLETQSTNGLETSENLVESEEPTKDFDKGQDTLDILDTGSYLQEPPLLTPEEDTETCGIKDDTQFENLSCCKNAVEETDNPESAFREELCDDTVIHALELQELSSTGDELPGKLAVADRPLDRPGIELLEKTEDVAMADEMLMGPGKELLVGMGSVIEKPLSSPQSEFLGELESVSVAEESLPDPRNELLQEPEAVTTVNEILEMPRNEIPEVLLAGHSSENELSQQTELVSIENEPLDSPRSQLQEIPMSLDMEEAKPEEKGANRNTDDEKGPDMLMDNNFNQSLEQTRDESRTNTSRKVPDTEVVKYFSEDNNEIVAMECDSFSSDQNESRIDQPLVSGKVEQEADSLRQDTEHSLSFPSSSDKKEEMQCSSELKKDKKTRTRRSRFHSPSTTWSPSKREGRRSQSPSPKREIVTEGRISRSPKRDTSKEVQRSLSHSPKRDPPSEVRSPSCSPKRDHLKEGQRSPSCSPKRDSPREGRKSSRTRAKESSPRRKGRSQSRDRDSDRDCPRRDHVRERSRRRWSQSRSRSRSRSRPRSKGPSFPRNERDGYSPPRWKERWTNDSWRSPKGNDRYKRNDQEKPNESMKRERESANKDADKQCFSDHYRKDYPDWVMERINSVPETRNIERERMKNQHWEENRHNNSGPPWNRNFGSGWSSNRGRGGRGRGGRGRGGFMYGEQSENRWQTRKPHSGNANNSGNESSRFSEHQPYKRKTEQDFSFDSPADRSGWTSASSWAVRKTLPADVQNYYSRRGRNSSSPQSAWTRQEEAAPEQDPNFKDQTNQQGDSSQLSMNMLQPQMNVMTPVNTQPQPMNIFPYPMGVPAPIMNIQHNPFSLPPPVPMHLHTGVPLVQVAAPVSQGPPPPPPPPPPSQQVNYVASQLDGKQLQTASGTSHVANNMSTPLVPAPSAALGSMEAIQGPSSGNATSSSNVKTSNAAVKLAESKVSVTVEASADSSKKDQKLLIQEKAAQEVKLAIKPFYQNKDITKEEYKEIVRKAVDKVCHSKSGEVNSAKVANLVKAYVDKYKHSRKKNPEEVMSVERK
ncbi:protein SCAF11 [Tiliqua scincoides]|uniref:protein SCAF11 n=1 Tax=Tiliqua scincoides TaxID=71010 RepID=UPI003461FD00